MSEEYRNAAYGWTRDNYGPLWIPKKGEKIDLNMNNIAIYERPIKVYEGIGKLRDPSKVMAWVYQVMVNECINRCKRAKRTEYIEEMVTEPEVFQPDTFAGEEVVMKLQLLPPRPRAVFNMLEVEELTEEEAAARLKTSVGNVRTLMSRAKRMLRDMLTK